MKRIFIDIGSHNGQTLLKAFKEFPNCDLYIGIEPILELIEKAWNVIPENFKEKVLLYPFAIDYMNEPQKNVDFYEDMRGTKLGSSLYPDKNTPHPRKITISCIDIRQFFKAYLDDKIILKLDVEGKEYNILKGMMKHNLLSNVEKIFIEWHWHKVKSLSKEVHIETVKQLNALGFNLTGESRKDEFYNGF